jgi:hypothetical protein
LQLPDNRKAYGMHAKIPALLTGLDPSANTGTGGKMPLTTFVFTDTL